MGFIKKLFAGKKSNSSDKKLKNWKELTEYFAGLVKQRLDAEVNIEWGSEPSKTAVKTKFSDGFEYSTWMGNYHGEYEKAPENLEALSNHWIGLIEAANSQEKNETLDNVLPVIKSKNWLETSQQQIKQMSPDQEFKEKRILRKNGADLLIAYVIDTPASMSYVVDTNLESFGLSSEEELFAAALSNLEKKASAAEVQGGGGRYAIRLDGFYDSSLALLLDKFLPDMQDITEPVLAIPERGELLVCCKTHTENFSGLGDLASRIFSQANYQISSDLYRIDGHSLHKIEA